jgi:hypothetical protein
VAHRQIVMRDGVIVDEAESNAPAA